MRLIKGILMMISLFYVGMSCPVLYLGMMGIPVISLILAPGFIAWMVLIPWVICSDKI